MAPTVQVPHAGPCDLIIVVTAIEVETKAMNRAARGNIDRFPDDFMFQLTKEEFLRCQIGTSNGRGDRRYATKTASDC